MGDQPHLCVCLQELQCDVSVEEDSRQEWTFTLYDFDNNGKVTREVSAPDWPPAMRQGLKHRHPGQQCCPLCLLLWEGCCREAQRQRLTGVS